jgi:hypothetical protein
MTTVWMPAAARRRTRPPPAPRSGEAAGWSEQVARHQDHVDFLGQGEVDRPAEGVELPLALGGRRLAEVVVSSTEMDVGQVQESRHLGAQTSLCRFVDGGS